MCGSLELAGLILSYHLTKSYSLINIKNHDCAHLSRRNFL